MPDVQSSVLFSMFWLIPVVPLFAAFWIALGYVGGWNRGEKGELSTARIAVWSALLVVIYLLVIDVSVLLSGQTPGLVELGTWFSSGDFKLPISFMLDGLGLTMATLVAVLSLISLRFAVNYLHREAGFQRFFLVMSLYMSAMLTIMLAGSATLTFVGWELAGLSSYLLIAYAFDRDTATQNATRVFITNRIGDAGFIMAIALSYLWIGDISWNAIGQDELELNNLKIGLIAASFILAALVKSAQFPFCPWISRALEGPTPSSAIFYGALSAHAGVYLIIRLQPLFEQVPEMLWILGAIGVLSMIYGFFGQLVQTDFKSALIFSTITQIGLMLVFCGLGWFELASWYMYAHIIWRVFQFLNAPSLMHLKSGQIRPVPSFIKQWRWLYIASLQRFWLENLGDWLLVKPTQSLSRDLQYFDDQVVTRMVGLSGSANSVSSLAQWEEYQLDKSGRVIGDTGDIGHGRGALGRMMQWVASLFYWFEEHLLLTGGDQGIQTMMQRVGKMFMKVDELLSQPRYLMLLIMATLVVIL
ncbi:MAG: proton-conducting transporter membrane subunit [Gammaproteobacteria bacterium]|nr:proton-conducting transporter membrane subunit [Gammaproteobacteria bacterium]